MPDAIAITGMACRYPDAATPDELWANILARRVSFQDIERQRWQHDRFLTHRRDPYFTSCKKVAWLDDVAGFAAAHFDVAPRRAATMDPQQRLMLELAREAICDAGLEKRPFNRLRSAVFLGAGVSEYSRMMVSGVRARQMAAGEFGCGAAEGEALANRIPALRAYTIPGSLQSMAASVVSQYLDLGGPCVAVDAACAASLSALVQAVGYLRGLPARDATTASPAALVGGVYLNLLPDNLLGFYQLGALAKDRCRPFDAEAEGFLLGEGAGLVVLKRAADAAADGDRIYAVIRGVAWNSDGRSSGPVAPRLEGQVQLLEWALEDADVAAESIAYVECHGTGTVAGDQTELKALSQIFPTTARPRIGSIKANIGHTLYASGVAGVIRAALAIYHGVLPPQAGWARWSTELEPLSSRFTVETRELPWSDPVRRAAVNAFGFGGTNACAILEQAPETPVAAPPASLPMLFCCSAPTPALLDEYLGELARRLQSLPERALGSAAYTLTAARSLSSYAALFVARSAPEALTCIAQARSGLAIPPACLERVGACVLLGPVQTKPAALAFLFPGQAEKHPVRTSPLSDRFSRLASILAEPDPSSAHVESCTQEGDPRYGVALARAEMALGRWMQSSGVTPSVLIGHSLGELTAASLAGWLEKDDVLDFAGRRAAAFERCALAPGGVLLASLDEREAACHAQDLGLHLAGMNHPRLALLAGEEERVLAAERTLRESHVSCVRLAARNAFHSPIMDPARRELDPLVETLRWCMDGPHVPVFTTVAGADGVSYRPDLEWLCQVWKRQVSAPTEFSRAVRAAEEAAAPALWLELGPGQGLCQCVQATLAGVDARPTLALSVGEPHCEASNALLALGAAHVLGHSVMWEDVFPAWSRRLADLPFMPLVRERHWIIQEGPVGAQQALTLSREPSTRAEEGAGAVCASIGPNGAALRDATDVVAVACNWPAACIRADHRLLSQLGFDSLMAKDLSTVVARRFGIDAGLEFWRSNPTVSDLAKLVDGNGKHEGRETPRGLQHEGRETPRALPSEIEAFEERWSQVHEAGVESPYFHVHDGLPGAMIQVNGHSLLNFSHYNYLGLNGHEEVMAAARSAVEQWGTSAGASRLVAGELTLHRQLERELADFLGHEDCVVMVSGHATNVSTISKLVGPSDLILHDGLIHDSVLQGAIASRAARRAFPHDDVEELERLLVELRPAFRQVLLVVEGVYSMDGDVCNLPALAALKERFGCMLMIDEAHSLGVLGPSGRGVTEHFGLPPSTVDVCMGTLSKTLASCGGYVCGSHRLVQYLRYNVPGFVYSVGMPPASAAAALAAVRVLRAEPERVERLARNSRFFREQADAPIKSSPIVPIILGDDRRCCLAVQALARAGVLVTPILYPAVAEGASRLRFFVTCQHSPEELRYAASALKGVL